MALRHAESRLPPLLNDCHFWGDVPRGLRRCHSYPGYTPHDLLQHCGSKGSDDSTASHYDSTGSHDSTAAPESSTSEALISPRGDRLEQHDDPEPDLPATSQAAACAPGGPDDPQYPDTDSDFDYTAVRSTWRNAADAVPTGEQPEPAPPGILLEAGGVARAPHGPPAPQRLAGVDQPLQAPAAVQAGRCRGRRARAALASTMKVVPREKDVRGITTVMLRNLPVRCKTDMLVHALDISDVRDTYDFCYVPCDFVSGNSKGYAFVNFQSPAIASYFKRTWHGTERFPDHLDNRALQVTAAHIQGYEANITMASKAGGIRSPNYRRLVFSKRTLPAASPASELPATPSQSSGSSGSAEGAVPQGPRPRPPGTVSVCVGAGLQESADERSVQHQSSPAGWPSAGWLGDLCRQAGRAAWPTCAPGPHHIAPQQQLGGRPAEQVFLGLTTAQRIHFAR
mmetsp:Transcript_75723/g.204769  ORF Transcript_75723/g.204769 Transcript_75723/m.204769 type:complete len:454 (-) Transcript_75723:92-1453(-)